MQYYNWAKIFVVFWSNGRGRREGGEERREGGKSNVDVAKVIAIFWC